MSNDVQIGTCEDGDSSFMTRAQKDYPTPWRCQISVSSAAKLEGPWGEPIRLTGNDGLRFPLCPTNPAPLFNDDGSVDLYFRSYRFLVTDDKSDESRYHPYPQEWLFKTSADTLKGPYKKFTPTPILQGQGEDAYVWRDEAGVHMLFNNKFNDKVNMGGYAFSKDGKRFISGVPVYSEEVTYLDGFVETVSRRERPQIMWLEEGKGVLFQGVRPDKKSDWVYTLATPIGSWTDVELQEFEAAHPGGPFSR